MHNNLYGASSLTKLFWLTVLAISLLTNPTSSAATAPIEKTTNISGSGGADSWYTPNRGYQLKTVTVYLGTGIKLDYCPSSGTCTTPVSHCYGPSCSSGTAYPVTITQIVTQVQFCYTGIGTLDHLTFTLLDGSTISTTGSSCSSATTVPIVGNFIGIAVIPKTFFGIPYFDDKGSAWDDNECSFLQTGTFWTPALTILRCSSPYAIKYATDACSSCFTTATIISVKKNGTSVTTPSWITHNQSARTFTVSTPINTDFGATFEVFAIDGSYNSSFTITTVDDCLTTVLNGTITNMSTNVNVSAVNQVLSFTNTSSPTIPSWSTCCGPMTYTLSPIQSFLSISGTTMSLATTNVANTGPHPTSLTISMANYPTITLTKNFTATIACLVQILTFVTAPAASTTLQVGIDTQPMDITFQTSQFPACSNTVTFSINSPPSFLSLPTPTSSGGNVRISGTTIIDHGTYGKTLTATVDGNTQTANFTVVIQDPCSTATIQITPATPATMNVIMPSVATSTQTFAIMTDVQVAHPTIVCPITATLTPSAAYISLAANNASISVNASLIVMPTDYGTHPFTLTEKSSNFPGTVAQQTYSFNVIITCVVANLAITSQVQNITYTLNQGALLTIPFTVVQTAACNYPFTYTQTLTKTGSGILQPTWITFNSTDQKFSITITAPSDIGTYVITSIATIPLNSFGTNIDWTTSYSFTLTVQSDCILTTITNKTITNISNKVSLPAVTQNLTFLDTVATLHTVPAYCGARTYTLSPTHAFLTISGTTLFLATTNVADVGIYPMVLTVSLTDYPMVQSITKNFDATIDCVVQTLSLTTTPNASTTLQVGIDLQPIQIAFSTSQFPDCGNIVTFSLNSPPSFMSIPSPTSYGGNIEISGALITDHSTYAKTLTATVDAVTIMANFSVFIKDPCSTAIIMINPDPLLDMSMIICLTTLQTPQPVNIYTDVQLAHPTIVCPVTAVITPIYPYIAITGDQKQIKVYGSLSTKADVGIQTMSLTINSQNFSSSVTQKVYSFQLELISDCILTVFQSKTVSNMLINVTEFQYQDLTIVDNISRDHGDATYCGPRVYTLSPTHLFLTINSDSLKLSSSLPLDEGTYPVTLTITLRDFPSIQYPLITVDKSFMATIQCKILSYNLKQLLPLKNDDYFIRKSKPLIFEFQFIESPLCGLGAYSLEPVQSFSKIIYTSSQNQVVISSVDLLDDGKYTMKLIAGPTTDHAIYGNDQTAFVTFDINLIDVCKGTVLNKKIIHNIQIKNSSSSSTQIISPFYEFEHSQSPFDCGPIEKKLVIRQEEAMPTWITLDSSNNQILINYQGAPVVFIKQFELIAKFSYYPDKNMTIPFNVTMNDYNIYCQNNRAITLEIGQEEPLFVATMYTTKTINDGFKMTPFLVPIVQDFAGNTINMPPFIKYQQSTHILEVFDVGLQDIGTYFLGLRIGYEELPLNQVNCVTKLEVLYKAKFIGQDISDQTLFCGKPWNFKIPTYTDLFHERAKVQVDLKLTNSFLIYEDTGNITAFDPDSLGNFVGNYKIILTLTDSVGQTGFVQFFLLVTCFEGHNKTAGEVYIPNFKLPPPKPVIQFINQLGRVRVGFSRPIMLPTFNRYPQFTTDDFMRQNCTNGYCPQYRRLAQKNLTDEQQAIEIVNRGIVRLNNTNFGIVGLKMIPGNETDPLLLNFTWTCIAFKTSYMDFFVNYTHYEDVSVQEYRDRLEVSYYGRQYFSTVDGQIFDTMVSTLDKPVPPQMNPESEATLLLAGKAVQSVSKAILILHFLLSLFLGGALQQLFSAIKKMQIMVHLLIVNVEIPTNAQIFFSYLLSLATFNIIDLDEPIRKAGNLYDDKIINENFYNLGYHSSYFIINMGNLYIAILGLILMLLLTAATQKIRNETFQKWRGYLVNKLCWNKVLSFLDESLLIIAISCLANFSNLTYNSTGKFLSSFFATSFGLLLIVYPIFLLIFLRSNKEKLKDLSFKNKFDSIYENLKVKASNTQLLEPFFSVMRILVLCISLLFLQRHSYFQLFIANFSVLFIVIYVGLAEPFKERKYHFFQQFNEVCIMFLIYHLWCFTDYLSDIKMRLRLGNTLIGFTCLNLFINMAYIMFNTISRLFFKIRLWYYKRKLAILYKKIEMRAKKRLEEKDKISPRLQYIIDLEKQENQPNQLLSILPEQKKSEIQLVVKEQQKVESLSVIEEEKGESQNSSSQSQVESQSKSESKLSKSGSGSDASDLSKQESCSPSESSESKPSQSDASQSLSQSKSIEEEQKVPGDPSGINQSSSNLIKPNQLVPLKQPKKTILQKTLAVIKPQKLKKAKIGEKGNNKEKLVEAKLQRRVIDLDELIDIQEKEWNERRRLEEKEEGKDVVCWGLPPGMINLDREIIQPMNRPVSQSPFANIQSLAPLQDPFQLIQTQIGNTWSFNAPLHLNDRPQEIPAVMKKKKVTFENLHQSMRVNQNQTTVNKRIKSPDHSQEMFTNLWQRPRHQ